MPNYKGHLFGGTTAFIIIIMLLSLYTATYWVLFLWLAACLAGALFPDIDTKSKGQQLFYKLFAGIVLLYIFFGKFKIAAILSMVLFSPLIVPHRGLFHKLWFLVLISCAASFALYSTFPVYKTIIISSTGFFIVGIMTHLWLDLGWRRMLSIK